MSILRLKKANCKNCYKCIRNCPIKAIEVVDGQAQIMENECVLCGNCVLVCPQNAKEVRNDVDKVRGLMASGKRVVASVAPSYISEFAVSGMEEFEEYLKGLGFAWADETAKGAYIVKSEYERLIEQKEMNIVISSCCPTVVKLIQKYYPMLIPYIAPVISPMEAHAKLIHETDPECSVVFLGPCISKKDEVQKYKGHTTYALTFDELRDWFAQEESGVVSAEEPSLDGSRYLSRFFPKSGGIVKTMTKDPAYRYMVVDGMEECIAALNELRDGKFSGCFIEMSACKGSCVNGPAFRMHKKSVLASSLRVEDYAKDGSRTDFDIPYDMETRKHISDEYVAVQVPGEAKIQEILRKMGKHSPEDELNCGTCGYSTCREKAIAVYYGKADISMCLPYMKEKAESFSDKIISATPNGIITVDTDLNIKQINAAACAIFNIFSPHDVIGSSITSVMDCTDFTEILDSKVSLVKKIYLAEYDKYAEETLLYDRENAIIICLLKDITEQEHQMEVSQRTKENAAEITDKVIEKQMRVVQEIASLLGETTAETKIALTKLKNTILSEDETH